MEAMGFPLRREAVLTTLTADVVKSGEIEGEVLDASQVRFSIARHLGMDVSSGAPSDRRVEGAVAMILDVSDRYDQALTIDRLRGWHASLFPTGRGSTRRLRAGVWRDDHDGPMQVVSGAMGHERVHFEAPAAGRLETEVQTFLDRFNEDGHTTMDPVMKAGLAHLWFATIHPFDDGNGRIARAIADLALARAQQGPRRFYSMSAQIRQERDAYFEILERTQKNTLDITLWMEWFLACLGRAIDAAQATLIPRLEKARFWQALGDLPLNERQRLMVNRLIEGSEGTFTTSRWATIASCSSDTALRDIADLLERGVLLRSPAGGRSTSYRLASAHRG